LWTGTERTSARRGYSKKVPLPPVYIKKQGEDNYGTRRSKIRKKLILFRQK
jgi:hypothetical protein